jgi:hypothetical protein
MTTTANTTPKTWRDQTATPDVDTFDSIIAAWSETLNCAGSKGSHCSRPARWRLDIHGCEVVLLCGHHLRAWERKAPETMDPFCDRCGRTWPTIRDAYTVMPI